MYVIKAKEQKLWATTNPYKVFPTESDRLEAYNEMAGLNDKEEKKEEDDEVYDYIYGLTSEYWDEKFEGANNLQNVVVTGYFGAWDGRKEIIPCKCKDIAEAISKCCNISGGWAADVYFETDDNGVQELYVGVSHHDGTCRYKISLLENPDEENYKKYKTKPITWEMVFGEEV